MNKAHIQAVLQDWLNASLKGGIFSDVTPVNTIQQVMGAIEANYQDPEEPKEKASGKSAGKTKS